MVITITVRDKSGKKGVARFTTRNPSSQAELDAAVSRLASLIDPIILGQVVSARAVISLPSSGFSPAPGPPSANVYRQAVLIFSEGGVYGTIYLRSPREDMAQLSEAINRHIITRARLEALGLLANVEGLAQGQVLRDGTPFPQEFAVGTLGEYPE